jgi:short-subunit dehydrogenase
MKLESRENLVALVTGASSGIGRATSLRLASRGVRVALVARREQALREVAERIASSGGAARIFPLDVTDRDRMRATVSAVRSEMGSIDILVVNAGSYVRGAAAGLERADFERSMRINFYGALDIVYEVLPYMLARRRGHVVAVTTVDAKKGLPFDAPYVAAKAALTGFMDVLRQELRGTGVDATTILPGRVDTPMIDFLSVPLISAKISPEIVAKVLLRAIERRKSEVVVPWAGPKALIVAAALSSALGDLIVRTLGLEGKTQSP